MRATAHLILFLAAVFAVAAFGAQFTPGAWYATLAKPAWTPPAALFAPVWTVLYLAIGVSGWLVWRRCGWAGARGAFLIYAVQLLLNGAWSWLFFGLHQPGLAFAEILVLWLVVAALAFQTAARCIAGAGWCM